MNVSNNSIAIASSCWKKWYWRYVERLEPKLKPINLTLGSVMHEAFDRFYKGTSKVDVLVFIVKSFDDELAQCSVNDAENMAIAKWTAVGMWSHYPHSLSEFEAVDTEIDFNVPLGRMRGVRLFGRVDKRFKHRGVWWLGEFKTTSNTSLFVKSLDTARQATTYTYAAIKSGIEVEGVLYDLIRKPALRRRVEETVEDFGKRIIVDYRDRPNEYYSRHYAYRNRVQLQQFEDDTASIAREMRTRTRKNDFPRNVDSCWNYNRECDFKKICFKGKHEPTMSMCYQQKKEMIENAETEA